MVDPGDEGQKVLDVLRDEGLTCRAILNTHTHIDHVGANQALMLGGLMAAPPRAGVDETIHQGDRVRAGGVVAEVLHTPGHTPGSLCFHFDGEALLLSGDTLFAGSIGRTDLWGGDFDQEIASIRERLLALDDRTRVIPGHGPETTIGRERRRNPFLADL